MGGSEAITHWFQSGDTVSLFCVFVVIGGCRRDGGRSEKPALLGGPAH
jgi:hypothetical protein